MTTLERLRELEKAATPGPWTVAGPGEYGDRWIIQRYPPQSHIASSDDRSDIGPDFSLIAAARNALPDLLAVVEAARLFVNADEQMFVMRHRRALRAALERLDR